jgi:hypothetical protein
MQKSERYNLVGIDGNAFSVMGYTRKAMKEQGYSIEEIKSYANRMMQNTYSYLIAESDKIIQECNKRVWEKELSDKKELENKINNKKVCRTQEELDSYFESLYDTYIPDYGKADTVGGEIVRAFCRINYRWFNDGDYAGYGYGMETVGPACTYLIGIPELEDAVENILNIVDNDEAYEKALLVLGNDVANYLDSNPNLFNDKNEDDFQDCDEWCGDSDEEEERKHWGDDSWYDEDEYDEDVCGNCEEDDDY